MVPNRQGSRIPLDEQPGCEGPLSLSEVAARGLVSAAGRDRVLAADVLDGAYLCADLVGIGWRVGQGCNSDSLGMKNVAVAKALAVGRRRADPLPRDQVDAERVVLELRALGHDIWHGAA